MTKILWQPTPESISTTEVNNYAEFLKTQHNFDWQKDFQALWRWSVANTPDFWNSLWDWHGVIGEKGTRVLVNPTAMPGAKFFPDASINYAENMLANADNSPAIIAYHESKPPVRLTRLELKTKVMALAGWLRDQGVTKGDCVAAYIPNIPEAIITMLATATLGAVYSSCSPDFGLAGAVDRFSQIQPKVLLACDGYTYAGKRINRISLITELVQKLSCIQAVLMVPFLDSAADVSGLKKAVSFNTALKSAKPASQFVRVNFNDPLFILYSSGTTGTPKCIVHGVGGTMLQHLKEQRLHCNAKAQDKIFYFTTCGWMMWNWLAACLLIKAVVVLYEGQPFHPSPEVLWHMADAEEVSIFGVSAKYIDALRKSGYAPQKNLPLKKLRAVLTTGSPLSTDGFEFVYQSVKPDVQLSSISGGTDIVSCFILGSPTMPVYTGELQTRGLGMAVEVLDKTGQPVVNQQGELCCCAPFPSMPIRFLNDPGGSKYQAAYFAEFKNIWRHGDWAVLNQRGGMVIQGRSDATLNPGGVRIGTAEIYRPVEAFDEITEAIAIGQDWQGDVRVILFVCLRQGAVLNAELKTAIKNAVRNSASGRHVPALIIAVPDIPKTKSGKITEIAVRDTVHGRLVQNTEALANPEALVYFSQLTELQS